jgi:hypothetical protein
MYFAFSMYRRSGGDDLLFLYLFSFFTLANIFATANHLWIYTYGSRTILVIGESLCLTEIMGVTTMKGYFSSQEVYDFKISAKKPDDVISGNLSQLFGQYDPVKNFFISFRYGKETIIIATSDNKDELVPIWEALNNTEFFSDKYGKSNSGENKYIVRAPKYS